MKENLKNRKCPLCGKGGSRSFEPLARGYSASLKRKYRVSLCKTCGHVEQNPVWSPKFYDSLYEHHVYDLTGQKFFPEQVERYRVVARFMYRALCQRRGSPSGAHVLDYGSYDGSFLLWLTRFTEWGKTARLFGYDITLMDIPKGAHFSNSLSSLARTKKRFDMVTMNHVLEHLLYPVETLTDIRKRFLQKDGAIVIEVPDITFVRPGDFSPFHIQHVNYFTPQTLLQTCKRAGLAVEELRTFRNYDRGRDPLYPTVLVVARADGEALMDGADIRRVIAARRKKLSSALSKLPRGSTIGVIGCGDPLSQLLPLIPTSLSLRGLFDNSKDLHGKILLGHKVLPVEEITNSGIATALISTGNERNGIMIAGQLRRVGFRGRIIRSFEIA
ncbi:MAG: class I SAM-dependent methyltransferase [bacterium]|nr:class I SAM-dependent methyltransferase [bacterium]